MNVYFKYFIYENDEIKIKQQYVNVRKLFLDKTILIDWMNPESKNLEQRIIREEEYSLIPFNI